MLSLWWLVVLVLGVILSMIGFGLRAHDGGVVLIGLGFLAALGAVVYKAIITFG